MLLISLESCSRRVDKVLSIGSVHRRCALISVSRIEISSINSFNGMPCQICIYISFPSPNNFNSKISLLFVISLRLFPSLLCNSGSIPYSTRTLKVSACAGWEHIHLHENESSRFPVALGTSLYLVFAETLPRVEGYKTSSLQLLNLHSFWRDTLLFWFFYGMLQPSYKDVPMGILWYLHSDKAQLAPRIYTLRICEMWEPLM